MTNRKHIIVLGNVLFRHSAAIEFALWNKGRRQYAPSHIVRPMRVIE
jgi:hypothetical protein